MLLVAKSAIPTVAIFATTVADSATSRAGSAIPTKNKKIVLLKIFGIKYCTVQNKALYLQCNQSTNTKSWRQQLNTAIKLWQQNST